jgi:hypothetical protein
MIDSTKLGQTPQKVELISVMTGMRIEVKDDGASLTSDGTFPNGKRAILLRKATEQVKLGRRSGNGPKFNAWVSAKRLSRSSGDPKKDPAMLLKTLDDTELVEIDGEQKQMRYADIMAYCIAYQKKEDEKSLDLVEAEARQKGATKEQLEKIQNEVAELKAESKKGKKNDVNG